MLLAHFYALIDLSETDLLNQFKKDIEEIVCCFAEKKNLAKGSMLLFALLNKYRNNLQFHEAIKNLLLSSKDKPGHRKAQEFYDSFVAPIYDDSNLASALSTLLADVKREDELGNIPLVKSLDQLKIDTNRLFQLKQNTRILISLLSIGIYEKDLRKLPLDQMEYLEFPIIQMLVFGEPPVLQIDDIKFCGERIKKYNLNMLLQTDAFIKMLEDTIKVLGAEKCRTFLLSAFQNDKIKLSYLPNLMNAAMALSDLHEDFDSFLNLIKNQTWAHFESVIDDLLLTARYKKFPERDIQVVIDEFGQKGPDVEFPLTSAEISQLKQQYLWIKTYESSVMKLNDAELSARLQMLKPECRQNDEAKYEILAIIRETVKRVFGLMPYNVQLLNVLACLNDPSRRRISQIKTGEGKSLVIVMLASYLAIETGLGIDITTTSNDLAIRDSEKYKQFYKRLALTSGNNVNEAQIPLYYIPKIVYGTNNDFRFGFLQNARGDERPFSYVIVDEVDNMFLDTLRNDARSSTTNLPSIFSSELYTTIWGYMSKNESASAQDLHMHIEKQLPRLKGKLEREEVHDFIISYHKAVKYVDGEEYVVIKDPQNGPQIQIVDYLHTGQISEITRWDKGLHSLLEVKHGMKPEPDSMLLGSISNPDYFNKYEHVFGLTGTLGTQTDRDQLKQMYDVNCYDSPSYRPSKKRPLPDIICENNGTEHADDDSDNDDVWMETIKQVVKQMVAAGRPVLILCETINESKRLFKKMEGVSNCVQIYNAMQSSKADDVLAMAGNPCAVTIATNTAGRGADINVTPVAEKKGGLHVIITFKCINLRVERQGFGRTGRQGREGTYQYIFKASDFPKLNHKNLFTNRHQATTAAITEWKKQRDYQSPESTQRMLLSRQVYKLKFITLEIYRTIRRESPESGATNLAWAEYYTRMDREVGKKNPNSEADLQKIAEKIFQGFANFWRTATQSNSSLDVDLLAYLEKNNAPLAKKFVQHCPPQIVAELGGKSSTISSKLEDWGLSLSSISPNFFKLPPIAAPQGDNKPHATALAPIN